MSTQRFNDAPPRLFLAGVGDDAFATAQESTPVPYLAGEASIPAHWISPIYNQNAAEAPQERPAKK